MATPGYSFARFTHPGRRRQNEDAVLVAALSGGRQLVAVADGMGGHAAGEVASARALEALRTALDDGAELSAAARQANAAVYAEATSGAGRSGMGTTLVAALIDADGSYRVVNVGDSRAYRIDEAAVSQVTEDHSFVAEAIRSGELSAEEAASSRWKNALTRAIGTDEEVTPDIFGPFAISEPHILVLCSDGLYKVLADSLLHDAVLGTPDIQSAVPVLAALAYRQGSDDNISVVCVECGRVPRRSGAITLPPSIEKQVAAEARAVRTSGAAAPVVAAARRTRLQRLARAAALLSLLTAAGLVGWGIRATTERSAGAPRADSPRVPRSTAVPGSASAIPRADNAPSEASRNSAAARAPVPRLAPRGTAPVLPSRAPFAVPRGTTRPAAAHTPDTTRVAQPAPGPILPPAGPPAQTVPPPAPVSNPRPAQQRPDSPPVPVAPVPARRDSGA